VERTEEQMKIWSWLTHRMCAS